VEGNHDRAYRRDAFSWLDYLAQEGFWTLLNALSPEGGIEMVPWDEREARGAYIDLPGGVRVTGVAYCGASTPRMVEELSTALADAPGPEPAYRVVMLHAGLQGVLDHYAATLTRAHLESLRPHADYLALGHIHKPFVQDDWIFNPGSLETNSVTEVEWSDRGYLYVEVDPGAETAHDVVRVPGRRRRFVPLTYEVTIHETPAELLDGLGRFLERQPDRADGDRPVVELRLTGTLSFGRLDLDLPRIEALVVDTYGALRCNVKDLSVPSDYEIRSEDSVSRDELERDVIRQLVGRDVRKKPHARAWTEMVRRLKRLALAQSPVDEIVEELRAFRRDLAAAEESPAPMAEGDGSC
jgi:DNA repair exonuclease SbcCD nuclease subunit